MEVNQQSHYIDVLLEVAIQLATILADEEEKQEEAQAELHQRRGIRRVQRRNAIWCRQAGTYGQYEQLLQELNREDPNGYKNFLRMDADLFGEIVDRISPRIKKQETNYR